MSDGHRPVVCTSLGVAGASDAAATLPLLPLLKGSGIGLPQSKIGSTVRVRFSSKKPG